MRLDLATESSRLDPTDTTFEAFGEYRAATVEHDVARIAFLEAVDREVGQT